LETPYKELPEDFKKVLLLGSGAEEIEFTFWRAGKSSKTSRPFEGVILNLQRLYQESESEFTRNRLKAFMSPRFCDACNGQRLKPEILAVRLGQEVQSPSPYVKSTTGDRQSKVQSPVTRHSSPVTLPGLSIMD